MSSLKFNYKYKILKGTYISEGSPHIGYGISVIDEWLKEEIMRIEDITGSRMKISRLISSCNRLQLSPVHIYDVIEDFLK